MSINNMPLVSVIMPAYNAEVYISLAIESILKQTYYNFELIIINDGSTDRTEEIISKYSDRRIIYLKNDLNKGISYSTNRGILYSKGKYIALMDDDDISLPDRLSMQIRYMEIHSNIDILGTGGAIIEKNGNISYYLDPPRNNPCLFKAILLFGSVGFLNGSAMLKKEFIENNKLMYQDNCFGMQDFMFFMEASKIGNISSIKEILYYHRVYGQNTTYIMFENYAIERAIKYKDIQKESFLRSGFNLLEDDFETLSEMINESSRDKYTVGQIRRLYLLFKKIIFQAENMKIDYFDELKYWCKKILADKILKSNIFESEAISLDGLY